MQIKRANLLFPSTRLLAVLCCFLVGCQLTIPGTEFRLAKTASDELRFHCDFDLPAEHPLITELEDQKGRLGKVTGLNFDFATLPIDIYLFRDSDSFEAFTSRTNIEFASRRAFFVKSDSMLNVYAQWGSRAAEDLRHEVTHGYLHSVAPSLPLWIDEGLAEYFEVGPDTGGLNQPHIQHLIAELESDRWSPSLGRMEALHDPTKLTQTDYAEAWLWTHFLLSNESTAALVRSQMQRYQNKTGTAWTAKVHHLVHDPNQRLFEHLESISTSTVGTR